MTDTWLTIKAAAERLGVAIPTVRVWCRQGRFPHAIREETPRGPVWRIPERDVASFERPPMGRPRKERIAGG
jgi:excisionase family DNA binding protein